MNILKDLLHTVDSIANKERLKAQSENQAALAEGLSIARSGASRARMDNLSLQEENLELMVENRKLKEAIAEVREFVKEVHLQGEAYAKVIIHLRKTWNVHRSEEDRRLEIKNVAAFAKRELEADQSYNKKINDILDDITQSKARK